MAEQPTEAALEAAHLTEAGTASGRIRGTVLKCGTVVAFLGVPFAQPPVGELRFAAPVAPKPWPGVLDATQLAAPCLQRKPRSQPAGVPESSEDCLYLNVFVPLSASPVPNKGRPVLVHFHGGGFEVGRAHTSIAKLAHVSGSVVVFPQYRLGMLGFFSPGVSPANFGIQDQQMALEWVRDNAAAFGGDPARVLIFGCSAGAAAVSGHLVLPRSFGLYAAAALESPGGHKGWMQGHGRRQDDWLPADLHLLHSSKAIDHFQCRGADVLACMRSINSTMFLSFAKKYRFAPALPGHNVFPLTLIRKGQWSKVPLIVGSSSCEGCPAASRLLGPPGEDVNETELLRALSTIGLSQRHKHELLHWYAPLIGKEDNWYTLARILSDSNHACSALFLAEAAAQTRGERGGVWRFLFAHQRPGSKYPGAPHCGSQDCLLNRWTTPTIQEKRLMKGMAMWWTSLAALGNPNQLHGTDEPLPVWHGYAEEAQPAIMLINESAAVMTDADAYLLECEHWRRFFG